MAILVILENLVILDTRAQVVLAGIADIPVFQASAATLATLDLATAVTLAFQELAVILATLEHQASAVTLATLEQVVIAATAAILVLQA